MKLTLVLIEQHIQYHLTLIIEQLSKLLVRVKSGAKAQQFNQALHHLQKAENILRGQDEARHT